MARSQNSFNKKQKEKKRQQKKKDKQARKEERQANAPEGKLHNMMAYVDQYGNILDAPPEEVAKKEDEEEFEIQISVPKKADETKVERRGKVEFFDDQKGFGFIIQDGTQEKYFVHESNTNAPLHEGAKVSFKIQRGLKGMDAVDVSVMK